jgi:CHAT domain-containing protein
MHALSRLLLFALILVSAGSVANMPPPTSPQADPGSFQEATPQSSYRSTLAHGQRLAAQGRYRDAAEAFEAGYRSASAAGDRRAAALFLVNLANARLGLHHYRQAMQDYLEARNLATSNGYEDLARVLAVNLAWLYRVQGAQREAEVVLRQAISGPPSAWPVQALLLLAELRFEQGDVNAAVDLFKQALMRAEQGGDSTFTTDLLEVYGNMLLRAGEQERAREALYAAFRRRKLDGKPVSAFCYRLLAELCLAEGDLQSAERLMSRSFQAAQSGAALTPLWTLFYSRARVRQARGDLEGALADLNEATESIASLRLAYLPAESVRAGASVGLQKVYDLAVEVSASLYRKRRSLQTARLAFELAERSRAIAFREALEEFERIRPHLPAEYFETLRQLSDAENLAFRAGTPETRDRVGQLRLRLTELEAAAGLGAFGQPRSAPGQPRRVTVASVQQVLAPSEALLSFHLGAENAYLWALTRERFEMHSLGPSARLTSLVGDFRRALTAPSAGDTEQAHAVGAELERLLFGRLSREVRRKSDWLLLVDRALFELPFAALPTPGSGERRPYLIERHSLRLVPSAAMLLAGRGEIWRGPLVAVGDPVYNRADRRWSGKHPPRFPLRINGWGAQSGSAELARLAASRREIESAAAAYRRGSAAPILLFGPDASRQRLEQALAQQPAVLHLATHVVPSTENPHVGMIALSLRPDGTLDLIGMEQIAAMAVRPALVVMSGCRSGGGALLAGEGLWGLARAWLRAGALSVAATLWPVPDLSGDLLERFYHYLSAADPSGPPAHPERALRRAQIDMIRSGSWRAQPAHWAAYFVLSRN